MLPRYKWMGWIPLAILPAVAFGFRNFVAPWIGMWILAVAIFAGFKWWTWWQAVSGQVKMTMTRSMAFLFLWPGMDADRFLATGCSVPKPRWHSMALGVEQNAIGGGHSLVLAEQLLYNQNP